MIDEMIARIGWTLVHTVWQGAAIAALLAVVLVVGSRLSSAARYLFACAALVAVVGAAGATFISLGRTTLQPVRGSSPLSIAVPIDAQPIAKPQAATPSELPGRVDLDRMMPWVAGIWIVGVVMLSAWQFGGWVLLRRLRRSAGEIDARWGERFERLKVVMNVRRVVLAMTDRIDVPIVVGALRPIVLAPVSMLNGLSVQQVEAILAHELAHVKRFDYLVNLIQTAVETLLFYHPAVWWIGRQVRREREHCCDEWAACVCGDRTEYARALTALEQTRAIRLAPAARGGRSELLMRVRRLLGVTPRSSMRSHCWAAGAMLLVLFITLAVPHRWSRAQTTAPAEAQANQPASNPVPSPIGPEDFVVDDRPYQISENDLVQIAVGKITKVVRVSRDGLITLPYLGDIKVAGLSAPHAQRAIEQAYKDANLVADGPIELVIVEQRGRMFNIFGAAKSGQFMILDNDFRLFDALVVAGGAPKRAAIKVVRGQRVIEIPSDKLDAGDQTVNIIIRPGDFIMVEEPQLKPLRIAVHRDRVILDGKPTDWAGVRAALEQIAPIDRRHLFIEVSAGSGDLPVKDFFQAKAEAAKLVSDLRFAHLSEVGIEPGVRQPRRPGEYYMGGLVKRTGVYSLNADISIKQAIIAAGGPEQGARFILLVRRTGEREQFIRDIPLQDLLDGKHPDVLIQPGDQIMVRDQPTTGPAEAPAPQ